MLQQEFLLKVMIEKVKVGLQLAFHQILSKLPFKALIDSLDYKLYKKSSRKQLMSLNNIYFILVRPQMGENIGSVARAIKNFNIKYLRIVNPRCNWPNQKANNTSVGAKDILKSTQILIL